MAISRADLKLKLKKYISTNARLLNTAKGMRTFLDVFIDSAVNTVDDGSTIGNVKSDWNATSGEAEILNKPATFTPSTHSHLISAIVGLQDALDLLASTGYVDSEISALQSQIDGINVLLNSDNVDLDSVQELVDAIETIQLSLSTILVNDLTTGGTTKALTAQQGVVLKGLIDSLTTAVGLNTTHRGLLNNPHAVTKSQVGLGNVDNTSDTDKPISTAQATAIGLKEDASNKSTSTAESASTTKFPVWAAIVSYFSASQIRSVLGITTLSGDNTGDETTLSIQTKRPLKTIGGNSLEGPGNIDYLIFGTEYEYFNDPAGVVTTSGAQPLTSVMSTFTKSVVGGNYKVLMSFNWTNASGIADSRFAMFIDGSQVGNQINIELQDPTSNMVTAFFEVVALTPGSHSIQLRIGSEAGIQTTVDRCNCEIYRVS